MYVKLLGYYFMKNKVNDEKLMMINIKFIAFSMYFCQLFQLN